MNPALTGPPHNVLFIIDQLCEMGGAERVLLNMIRLLPRDRFCPHLVTFKIDPSLGIFDDFPCSFHLFPLRRTWDFNAAKVAMRICDLVRGQRIDIVHTFFETSDVWGGPVARLSGARVLISSRRDMGILRSAKHRFAYWLANRFYDQIQAVSEQVRAYCIQQDRVDPQKVITLYNGVAAAKAAAARREAAFEALPALAGASHVITTTAHVRKVKGIDMLLRAAEIVCRRFPRALFVVVGDNHQPSHFEELMSLRRQLELENNVLFPGPIEDVFSVLKASDVFLLPSRSEGLSNALLEAMACGLPCVATDVGGNPELIRDGHNGFLVPSEDPTAMASRIRLLLDDPALAQEMGNRCRSMVDERFTTSAMMQQLVRSYERLLDSKSPDRR